MAKKCICEICTCGRHRCPHRPTNHIARGEAPCQLTEYKQVYKPHAIPERTSFKPSQAPMQGGQFADKTTHGTDYKAFPLEKPHHHQHEQYVKPQGDMEDTTSYKKEYTEKHGAPARPIKAQQQKPTSARFEGQPTYKADYKKWDPAGRPQAYGKQNAWNPPEQPFEGKTTFQHDYQQNEIQPRHSYKPTEGAKVSDTPFQENTTHRDDYKKHDIPKKFQREPEQYNPSGAPFDAVTTHNRDYKGAPGGRMQSFRPDNQAMQSASPFQDDTTHRKDFVRWTLEKPYHHAPEQYHKPDGDMDKDTTYKQTYRPLPIERVVAHRPVSSKKSNAPFDGTTSYHQEFRRWEADRVKPKKQDEYTPNNAPFEGSPTYRSHYVPHKMQPQRSFRPDNTVKQSDARFDDVTNYQQDYQPQPIQTCEAALIDKPHSRFQFAELDQRGHRLYQPVMESISPLSPMRSNSQQRLAMSVA